MLRKEDAHMEGGHQLLKNWSGQLGELLGQFGEILADLKTTHLEIQEAELLAGHYLDLATIDSAFLFHLFNKIDGSILAEILNRSSKQTKTKFNEALRYVNATKTRGRKQED